MNKIKNWSLLPKFMLAVIAAITISGFLPISVRADDPPTVPFTNYPIARDGLCIIVNSSVNANITSLTLPQIAGIYNGTTYNWSQIYSGASGAIVPFAGTLEGGDRASLLKLIPTITNEQTTISNAGTTRYDGSAMANHVASQSNSIGYVGMNFDTGANIRTLKVVDSDGVAWSPVAQNIYANQILFDENHQPYLSGHSCYPLTRFLYLDIAQSNGSGLNYVNWMQNPNYSHGQDTFWRTPFLTLIPDADVGMHGTIDVRDIGAVGSCVGQTGAPHWIRADVNRDGRINVQDLGIVGAWANIHIFPVPQQ